MVSADVLAIEPELALYQRIYEGQEFRQYFQRSTYGRQIRFQLGSSTPILRQHDCRFRDQPSHDRTERICPACEEPDSIDSIQRVMLHCPAYEHCRIGLRTACLPAAQASPRVLIDDDGMGFITLLRDGLMGGAEEAAIAVDTFLHAISTFRYQCMEQFGN